MPESARLILSSTYQQALGTLSADETFAGGEIATLDPGRWPDAADGMIGIRGDQAGDQTITGGKVWVRSTNYLDGVWLQFGALPNPTIVSTTKGVTLPLWLIGAFAEAGFSVALSGAISAGGVVVQLAPLEITR